MGLALAGRPAERREDDLGQVPEAQGPRAGSLARAGAAAAAGAARALKARVVLHDVRNASCFLLQPTSN